MRGQELRYLDLFCCLLLWANFVSLYSPLDIFFRKKNSTMRSHSFIAFSGLNYQVFINFSLRPSNQREVTYACLSHQQYSDVIGLSSP
jgi:hypothetical protein